MDDIQAAVSDFLTVGDVLRSDAWLTDVHKQIGLFGKDQAKAIGGTFRIWAKKSHSYRNVPLTAKFDNDPKHVVIKPIPPGLWAMQETGARSHRIPKQYSAQGKKLKGKGRRTLKIPGSPTGYADHAFHPGRRGQERWTRVNKKVREKAAEIVDEEVRKVLARSFNGG